MIEESKARGTKNRQFYPVFVWIGDSMPRRYVPTYACMFAMHKTSMSCSAVEIGRRTQRSEGTIRKHIHDITHLGLWEAQPRYRDGARISNTYLFLRLPIMPDTAAAEPFVVERLPGRHQPDAGQVCEKERGPLAGRRYPGDATSGTQPLSETRGLKSKREDLEPNNSNVLRAVDLPLALRFELKSACAGNLDACLRALQQETRGLRPDKAKPLQIAALHELCAAAKRGPVRSPAALARTIVRANLRGGHDHVVAVASFETELAALDSKLSRPSTPFAARRTALERARFYLRVCEVDHDAARELPEVPSLPGRRGRVLAEMVRCQIEYVRASHRDDGLRASAVSCQLDMLEAELKRAGTEEEAAE